MRIAVCSIGTELVDGAQVDTNAAWIGARMRELGARDVLHVAVDDDPERIVGALRWLAANSDGVVVGGGLGPTSDDRTREAVATAVGRPLERREDLVAGLEARFRDAGTAMPAANLSQADVPQGAHAWPPVGSAPGFVTRLGEVPLWVLPGVPWELRTLFDRHVAPDVLSRSGGRALVTRVVHVTGAGESDIAERLTAVEQRAAADGVEVAYLATGGEVLVKLTSSDDDRQTVATRLDGLVADVQEALGDDVAGLDGVTGPVAVVEGLRARGWTVAVAESATAGMLAATIASVPGASVVLRGGVVVYATDTKASLADVPSSVLAEHPPVSREVTVALAEGVRRRLGADVGVATTGVAGPDEQDGVAVGTCWWAVALPEGDTLADGTMFRGDRATVRRRLTNAALDALRRSLTP